VGGRGKIEGGGEDEIRKGKKKTKKKKKSYVECHIRVYGFGYGELGVSVATL